MTPETILLRQAHPKFMDGQSLTSQVFCPFPKDKNKLSVYDGDMITAENSHRHYTEVLKNQSHSVWGVSKVEVESQGTSAEEDPLPSFPEHAVINFGTRTDKECRKLAKKIKALATARGCLFAPGGQ